MKEGTLYRHFDHPGRTYRLVQASRKGQDFREWGLVDTEDSAVLNNYTSDLREKVTSQPGLRLVAS